MPGDPAPPAQHDLVERTRMADLVQITFPSEAKAEQVRQKLRRVAPRFIAPQIRHRVDRSPACSQCLLEIAPALANRRSGRPGCRSTAGTRLRLRAAELGSC